ncbi:MULTISPECIES: division/cell wall cluster transcriptional repressor MraZ [unclassified Leeuwenhoekiella]|uniref:division/cell wall cluster transcriptional repressor MraZ n=1 Tax=unclassified Leeuwenhoekiella TaxID=2615029 RepID=UPI000C45097E|nr:MULTISPECIES: division/cell wall cluster transcriptional repressor MraZ [unclassified Leeuwenhoekiella]MAW96493.1 division/cell wall cluster transcriptional repressor MraZ [Leeuwenhoekiella sp.]MBA81380.1 division/cell wall cluster transcriptional repressor MraZ [Leeuwenhoekiella sp.]
MLSLIGTYECKVDTKGRLMMPAALKKQLAKELQEGFVVKRSVFNSCLELWPMSEWEVMMQKLNGLNRFVKKNVEFIRRFTAGVKMVEADASGRLLIPKDLITFAAISKDIVLTSGGNIIEIWDLVAYETAVSNEDGDFASLAEEVMGDQNSIPDGLS